MCRKISNYLTLIFLLFIFQAAEAGDQHSPKNMMFLSLTISIACDAKTPVEYQVQYMRALGARPEVELKECGDKRSAIIGLLSEAADVEYSDFFHLWLVAIILKDSDALNLQEFGEKNVGKLMLIGVNNKIL